MKKMFSILMMIGILCAAADALAVDLAAVDRVSVLMPKAKVLSILGNPDETITLPSGLKVDVYRVPSAPPLIYSGCIYDKNGILMGQSFVFQGRELGSILERLKKNGFVQVQKAPGPLRLTGFDDDTGQPLVAVVAEEDHLTTITTFEKAFYEAHNP